MFQKMTILLAMTVLPAISLHAVTYNCPTPDKVTIVLDGQYRGPLKGWSSGKATKQPLPADTQYFAELKGDKLVCRYNPRLEYIGEIIAKGQSNPVKCPADGTIAVSSESKESHFKGNKTGEWRSEEAVGGSHAKKTQSCTYKLKSVNPPVYVMRTQGISAKKCTPPPANTKFVVCK